MKTKPTDIIINLVVTVAVHGFRKKPTKSDDALAKKLSNQGRDVLLQLLTYYINSDGVKREFYEHKKGQYAVREVA